MRFVFSGLLSLLVLGLCAVAHGTEEAARIYAKQCATCHGDKGGGHGRAGFSLSPVFTDFTDPVVQARLGREQLMQAIRQGVAGTAMVGYGRRFDEQTMEKLATYIQTEFMGQTPSARDGVSLPPGKAIYQKHCSACHGDNGNTAVWARNGLNPPPRNFTSEKARQELSLERMLTSITYGRPGTAMMPFAKRLSRQEIQAVVAYIRRTFMEIDDSREIRGGEMAQEVVEQVAKRSSQAGFPDGLKGDWRKGKEFYESNCYVCHGLLGNGKGPRAFFNRPAPRDFTSAESRSRFDRLKLFNSIKNGKPGSVMPAWGTVLSEQQIANVAEYVFRRFIQGGEHPGEKKNS